MTATSRLFYGDNLEVLPKHVPDASVDVVYLDPPFNSNKIYNIIFDRSGEDPRAQLQAFDDTWRWTHVTEEQYGEAMAGGLPLPVAEALRAFRALVGESNLLAYLVNMAPRLVELHRVLKDSGSLFLHCDPTASHYLKILLDAIFGAQQFQNEIIWAYRGGGVSKKRFGRKHDVILFYAKRAGEQYFKPQYTPYSEATRAVVEKRGQRVNGTEIDVDRGGHMPDWWTDINSLQTWSPERLGYPTQKPEALLERILDATCPPDGLVLDPFCGCGTTVTVAQRMGRRWLGIDITYIAIHLIKERLRDAYGPEVDDEFTISGIPRDMPGAEALFKSSAFDFERWAVSLVDGQPNQKSQVGDKGIDGVIRFPHGLKKGADFGRALVSVKGGRSLNPAMVRDLAGTVQTEGAEMGVLITMAEPTRGMKEAAEHAGTYMWPINRQTFPRIQVITVRELLNFKRPNMPPAMRPYTPAIRQTAAAAQLLMEIE